MQHAKLKPASDISVFFQALAGFAIAALVMVGVAGTVYKLISSGGWFAQLLGTSVTGGLSAVLALMVMGLCAWLARSWITVRSRNRYPDVFVYLFAIAGAIYAVELLTGK